MVMLKIIMFSYFILYAKLDVKLIHTGRSVIISWLRCNLSIHISPERLLVKLDVKLIYTGRFVNIS